MSCALQTRSDIAAYDDMHKGEQLLVRFGLSVTLAAHIGDWDDPGRVLVNDVVRQLLLGNGLDFTLLSHATRKGFDAPVALFEMRR